MRAYRLLHTIRFRELLRLVYRIEVSGGDRIPAQGACIVASNHESLADPFLLGVATRRPIRYMAKAELYERPWLRTVMEAFGTFPIERGAGDVAGLAQALRLLERGELLGIFPQGTSKPLRERPFHRGAARLALATGAPLVPVRLVNTEKVLRPVKPKLGLPKVRIVVGKPLVVTPQRPTIAAARELTRRLEEAIAELGRPYGPPAHVWLD